MIDDFTSNHSLVIMSNVLHTFPNHVGFFFLLVRILVDDDADDDADDDTALLFHRQGNGTTFVDNKRNHDRLRLLVMIVLPINDFHDLVLILNNKDRLKYSTTHASAPTTSCKGNYCISITNSERIQCTIFPLTFSDFIDNS